MTTSQVSAADRARQTLELLPVLRRWATARVHRAGADAGLSLRQYAALSGIRHGASSPGELARLWQVTPAVITGIIDRLERRELVRREPDPDDRRRLRLALTDAGLAASELVERSLTDELAVQLSQASPDELAELGRALDLLQRTFAALEAQTAGPVRMNVGDDLPVWDDDCACEEETTAMDESNRRRSQRTSAGSKARLN
ncbi:MAG TPA: MarR family winged helix-turn-helix transcriptional regulator [Thermomicrobiales bacterium]|nr:MarR family winged helix-turn-helix transcriptional regulator [Thermomicrobiales bacterium]